MTDVPAPRNKNGGSDPSRNVLDLVDAANLRQDDLREAESRHFREVLKIRDEHNNEMRLAEAARLDAIRAVDVAASSRAEEVASDKATALEAQVVASAEALRKQVEATATAYTVSLKADLDPIKTDIAELRRVQYEQAGAKQGVGEQKQESRAGISNVGVVIGGVAGVVSLIMVIATLYIALTVSTPPLSNPVPAPITTTP